MASSTNSPIAVCETIRRWCAPAGFDLVHPLQVGWYNSAVAEAYRVPDFGRPSSLAIAIGNTRALWSPFCLALRRDAKLAEASDPLNRYTERVLSTAMEHLEHAYELRFSHESPPRRVAMQRLAHVSGLAYLTRSQLNVHPAFGPWIGLRALALVDVCGPFGPAPEPVSPCDCEIHCARRFREAVAATTVAASGRIERPAVEEQWRLWLAVRDACPVGREHRYSDDQIRYHYLLDRRTLIESSGRRTLIEVLGLEPFLTPQRAVA